MPNPLFELIFDAAARSPIGFDEYMRLALYSDPHGYYRTHVPAPGSDYRTSPTLTAAFGKLVSEQLRRMWVALGSPDRLTVVEVGGGGGELASSVLSSNGPLAGALTWNFVEPIPGVAKLQQENLSDIAGRLRWVSRLDELDPVEGVLLAHEVLDNFPVRLFEVGEDRLREVRVGVEGPRLSEVLVPAPEEWLPAMDHLEPGDRFEMICGLDHWCAQAAAAVSKGQLMVVDYGDVEPDIWVRRPSGSLVTYREEGLGVDPLASPGSADITAHVNFSELARAANWAGMAPCPVVSQRAWLKELGLDALVENLRSQEAIARREGRHGDWVGLVAERSRAEALAARGGLGDHLVFRAGIGMRPATATPTA